MTEQNVSPSPDEEMPSADALVDDMPDVLTLAGDFPQASQEDWEKQVLKIFNRKRPEDDQLSIEQCMAKLRSTTVEGIEIEPLYLADDRELGYPGVAPFRRGTTVRAGEMDAWDVRQMHEDPDPKKSRAAVLADLERGVTSLWLRLGDGAIGYDDLGEVLADVEFELAPVAVSGSDQEQAARTLLAVWQERGVDPAAASGNLGIDPLGQVAERGGAADFGPAAQLVKECLAERPGVRALVVDTAAYHNAGASDVEELAFAIATGVQYLRSLEEQDITPEQVFEQIDFRVSATADQFATIARLRALRELWEKVGRECEVPEESRGARQHAVTSWRMMTRDDPYVNMLRVTTATFAASVGGAESITVLPFDHVHGLADVFSRRIARNTQIVLAEEANIGRVNDPAGGSWFVETLTDQLVEGAWKLFQEIESAGGMAAALESDFVRSRLEQTTSERRRRIAKRQSPITGVSMFPMVHEKPLDRDGRPEQPSGGLPQERDSEIFERLRDRSAAQEKQAGSPPRAFLATIGLRRDYGARETFVSSLLAAAAIDAPATESTSPDEMVEGFKQADTKVAVLCSSAKMYAEHALPIARALKEAGATKVYLAGSERELAGQENAGAIDDYIYAGMDAVTLLSSILDEVGVPE